jgi:acetylornithine/N-succinyldiaminopimelate aminotransferase
MAARSPASPPVARPSIWRASAPKLDGFDQVPLNDLAAVEAAIGPQTGAILLEPIQGESGIRVVPHDRLRAIRKLCDERGLLMILDEVQCGMGRTGCMFAHELAGVTPDIMTLAKGMGGGFPLGACLATERVASAMTPGSHGTTFGGNPLAMAVGNAVLDVVLGDGFIDEVNRKALLFKQGLASIVDEFPTVFEEIRGIGLILGLKCRMPNAGVNMAFRAEKLLTVPGGDNVVRLLPPLTLTDDDIREGLVRIRSAAARLAAGAPGH